MRKLIRQEKIFLSVALVVSIFYLFRVYVWESLEKESQQLTKRAREQKKQLIRSLQIIQHADILSTERKEYFGLFAQQGSNEEQTNLLINDVMALALKMPLTVQSINIVNIEKSADFNTFFIRLSAVGKWDEIMRFIYALENQPYFFLISALQFKQEIQLNSSMQVQLVISHKFFLKQKE